MRAFLQGWGMHHLLSSHMRKAFPDSVVPLTEATCMPCFVSASVPAQGRYQLILSVTGVELTWQLSAELLVGADPEPLWHTLHVLPLLSLVLPVMAAKSPVACLASVQCTFPLTQHLFQRILLLASDKSGTSRGVGRMVAPRYVHQEPQNVTVFGTVVFADVRRVQLSSWGHPGLGSALKSNSSWGHPGLGLALKSNEKHPSKRQKKKTHRA